MASLSVLLHLSGLEMNSPQLPSLLKSPREGPLLHLATPPAPAAITTHSFCHREPSPQIRFILWHLLTGPVCSCSHNISSIHSKQLCTDPFLGTFSKFFEGFPTCSTHEYLPLFWCLTKWPTTLACICCGSRDQHYNLPSSCGILLL